MVIILEVITLYSARIYQSYIVLENMNHIFNKSHEHIYKQV